MSKKKAAAESEAASADFSGRTRATPTFSQEQIAQRAYEIYSRRGYTDGADLDDWFEAERQLKEDATTR